MKLSTNTDFTKLARAGSVVSATQLSTDAPAAFGTITLPHDERHLRRKVLSVSTGEKILVDLLEPVMLGAGDRLVLDDGRSVAVGAEPEELYAITPNDPVHLAELAWHIGNRHLAAAIESARILILRDHVIKAMLEGLGARVEDVVEPFEPVRGAYSGHGAHGHHHDAPVADAYGRLPGDAHYGHNHGPAHDHHDHHHGHDHHHHDDHDHHAHGERDRFGRLPGDPHYGHNHG
jgi:urease accessory protein